MARRGRAAWLVVLVLVAAAAGLATFLALDDADVDGDGETVESTSTTAAEGSARDQLLDELAAGLYEGSGRRLPNAQARCTAEAVAETLGPDDLMALGLDARDGDGLAELPSGSERLVLDAMRGCGVPTGTITAIVAGGSTTSAPPVSLPGDG